MYCLSVLDSFCTGMYIVGQCHTVSRQVCVLSVSMSQFLDKYVYCLSVRDRYVYYLSESDSFWTGMCIVCQYQTVSGQICVLSVRIRQFLDRYVYCLSV